ncbi:unnamed protein product [Clonostachys rhizophaga]|uniref:CCHC-type domain-containing protein n=1 Tax=Clonostachys rhizophaga TaxID=160324 RepID=A0A9N9UW57_9HYPO|nr:unnamed protein product [Clonostachys rhizophaga]
MTDSPTQAPSSSLSWADTKLPPPSEFGPFSGDEEAGRWISRLKWAFKAVNAGNPHPACLIQAIYAFSKGPPAVFLNSNTNLSGILLRAENGQATANDLDLVTTALRERYPEQVVDDDLEEDLTTPQSSGEALTAYYTRFQAGLKRAGGRDKSVGTSNLSQIEIYTLRTFVEKFVNGLENPVLKAEAVNQSALSADGLRGALDIVKRSQEIIAARERMIKVAAREARSTMLEHYIEKHLGMTPEEILSKTYGVDPELYKSEKSDAGPSTPVHAMYALLDKSKIPFAPSQIPSPLPVQADHVHYSQDQRNGPATQFNQYALPAPPAQNPSNESYHQSNGYGRGQDNWRGNRQGYDRGSYNRGGYQGSSGNRYDNRSNNRSTGDQTPYNNQTSGQDVRTSQNYQNNQSAQHRQGNQSGRGEQSGGPSTAQKRVHWDQQRSDLPTLPPRESSGNPYVNGSLEFKQGTILCIKCGLEGHISPACGQAPLQRWEQSYLKALIYPDKHANSTGRGPPPSGGLDVQSAQLHFVSMPIIEEQVDEEIVSPTVTSNSVQFVVAREDGVGKTPEPVNINSLVGAELKKLLTDDPSASDDVNRCLTKLRILSSELGPRKRRRGAGGQPLIEPLLDPESSPSPAVAIPTDPIESNDHAAGPSNTAKTKKSRSKGKKPAKPVARPPDSALIRGRENLGPIDWTTLARDTKVPISLLDLMQASPEATRQLRYLGTRGRQAVRQAAVDMLPLTNQFSMNGSNCQPKSFQFDVTIGFGKGGKNKFTLTAEEVQGDQGSDCNIVDFSLVREHEIPVRDLSEVNFHGLHMITADHNMTPVTQFIQMVVTCQGIVREQLAIVRPVLRNRHPLKNSNRLLLGLPWLWDVNAFFDIRGSCLTIGDASLGEKPVVLRGPAMSLGPEQRLMLALADDVESDSSSDESADYTDSDVSSSN